MKNKIQNNTTMIVAKEKNDKAIPLLINLNYWGKKT